MSNRQSGQQGPESKGLDQQEQQNQDVQPQETQEDQLVGPQGDLAPSQKEKDRQNPKQEG